MLEMTEKKDLAVPSHVLMLLFCPFWMPVAAQTYQASCNWIVLVFATIILQVKHNVYRQHPPSLSPLPDVQLSEGLVDLFEEGAVGGACTICNVIHCFFMIRKIKWIKRVALVIFLTLGVLIMVTHQCLNTSLLHCGWCCIWRFFGCTFL